MLSNLLAGLVDYYWLQKKTHHSPKTDPRALDHWKKSLGHCSKWKTKKRSLFSQYTYFRCGKVPGFFLEIEKLQLLKCHRKLLLNMTISNVGRF